jgi:hypothetical protein
MFEFHESRSAFANCAERASSWGQFVGPVHGASSWGQRVTCTENTTPNQFGRIETRIRKLETCAPCPLDMLTEEALDEPIDAISKQLGGRDAACR